MSHRLKTGWKAWIALPLSVRWAVIVWFAVIAGVTGRVIASKPTSQSVIPIYLVAGERWLHAENLYAPIPEFDVYRNPPLIAACFAPLTCLSPKVAGVVVRLISVTLFLWGLIRVRRSLLPELSPSQVGWMFLLATVLVIPSFNNGQVNILIAAVALHGVAAASQEKWWQAAIWLSFVGWVKLYPFAIGLLMMLTLPWRFGARFLLCAVAGFALPFVLNDPEYVWEQCRDYLRYLGDDDRTYAPLSRVPRDWTTIPRNWFDWVPTPTVTKIVSLTVAALFAALVYFRSHAKRAESLLLALCLASIWMTVFGPATEMNTYSLLAAVAPIIVVTCSPRPRWQIALASLGYGLLAITVLRGMFPDDWKFNVHGPQALGTLMLLVAMLWKRHGKMEATRTT